MRSLFCIFSLRKFIRLKLIYTSGTYETIRTLRSCKRRLAWRFSGFLQWREILVLLFDGLLSCQSMLEGLSPHLKSLRHLYFLLVAFSLIFHWFFGFLSRFSPPWFQYMCGCVLSLFHAVAPSLFSVDGCAFAFYIQWMFLILLAGVQACSFCVCLDSRSAGQWPQASCSLPLLVLPAAKGGTCSMSSNSIHVTHKLTQV